MISRFFSWWFGELAALLPAGNGGSGSNKGRVLVIDAGTEEVRVHLEGARGRSRTVGPSDPNRIHDAVQQVAATLDPSRTRVQVRLPAKLALSTRPSLPMAAEENLREVLGFEMDRLTPFRNNDVYFSYEVESRDRARQNIEVKLNVVRRKLVTPLLSALDAWSLSPASASIGRRRTESNDEQVCLDFAPSSYRQRSAIGLNGVLAAVVLGLSAYAVYLPIQAQREYRGTLEKQLLESRVEAAEATRIREQLELAGTAALTLANAKASRPNTVELLDTVSRLLPDHTFLFRFELRGDELSIQGNSQAASSLIALLDDNQWLTNVRFTSPVTRDARSGGERFHISAELLPLAPPPAEAVSAASAAGG